MPLRARHSWPLLFVLAVAACRTPPVQPAGCRGRAQSRQIAVARQVTADTVLTAAAHPVRSLYATLTEPLAYFRVWGAGIVKKRVVLKLLGTPPPIPCDRDTLDVAALEQKAERVSKEAASAADVCLFVDGSEARMALMNVIQCATFRLDVLMYLWGDDAIGWDVARQLAAKASPSLPVRVLVDGGGNLIQGEPKGASPGELNRAVCWLSQQPCVTVLRIRNPLLRLDHRKLVVADNAIAFSGGRNFVDKSFIEDHDLSYTVAGPLATQMAKTFDDFWHSQGGEASLATTASRPVDVGNAKARLVRTTPTRHEFARILYEAVARSRRHVYLENPYFSDNALIALLARARHRGADVRVVLTLDSGSKVFDRSNRVTANRLLSAGIRVYLYPGSTHAKALSVDGVWAYTGTANFNNLSLRHNRELGLAISGGPVIQELEERLFLPDLQDEWELTEPLKVGPIDYFAEFIASTFT
jgi:phosphatidylserine/phosphatidylglycerophosphate/cardiolipin synthase-like enzyme